MRSVKASSQMLFTLLSEQDLRDFFFLRSKLTSPDRRYNRNKRIDMFQEMLAEIKSFCERRREDQWKRCMVCGICWFDDGIACNTRQLRLVMGKSKSSINGALAKLGYEAVPSKTMDTEFLTQKIPILKTSFSELRQWTIRKTNIRVDMPRPASMDGLSTLEPTFSPIPTSISGDFTEDLPKVFQNKQIEEEKHIFNFLQDSTMSDWSIGLSPTEGDMFHPSSRIQQLGLESVAHEFTIPSK